MDDLANFPFSKLLLAIGSGLTSTNNFGAGIGHGVSQFNQQQDQQDQYGGALSGLFGGTQPGNTGGSPAPATAPTRPPAMVQTGAASMPQQQNTSPLAQPAPAMTYDGPLGKVLGNKASAILPFFKALPAGVGFPLLLQTSKALLQPPEYDPTPHEGINPDTGKAGEFLVGKDGSLRWLGATPRTKVEVTPAGDAYDPYSTAPGTHFAEKPNPNQPFNPDGSPNTAFQKYEAAKAAAAQGPAWAQVGIDRAKLAQDNYSPPVMIGFTGPDGEEVQKAGIYNKRTGKYLDAANLQPLTSTPNLRVIGNSTGGARSQAAVSRILTNAEDATSGIENLSNLSSRANGGLYPNLATTPLSALSRLVTPQEVQDTQATMAGLGRAMGGLATGGLAVDESVQKSYEGLNLNAGDTQLTKMRKLAEMRQQSTNALDVQAVSPILSNAQRQKAGALSDRIKKAVPWTVQDVQRLENSQNPNVSLRDLSVQRLSPTAAPGGVSRGVKWKLVTPGGATP